MKLLKVITDKTYKGSDGKEHNQVNFYLELDSGARICVKPAFKEDQKVLSAVSQLVDNRKQ